MVHNVRCFVVALILALTAGITWAIDYTVVDLSPTGSTSAAAYGIGGGQQVGRATINSDSHALLWSGSAASAVDLNSIDAYTKVIAVSGGWQAGVVYNDEHPMGHATLWSGSPANAIDLHSEEGGGSVVLGMSDGYQVGYTQHSEHPRAYLWHGSAASGLCLYPTESMAYDVNDNLAVGYYVTDPYSDWSPRHACGWGMSGNIGDINPLWCTSSTASAVSIDGLVVGSGAVPQYGSWHALLWTIGNGTVDLHPAAYCDSYATDIAGDRQVGYGILANDKEHALVWSGSAASAVDLHQFLPVGFDSSRANGIDDQGNIVGYAYDAAGVQHAILWAVVPEPGTVTMLSIAGLCLLGYVSQHLRDRR